MKTPIFFHNRHDTVSFNMIKDLPEGTQIIDVFGSDSIPGGYKVSKLPYLITKELELSSPPEITVGTATIMLNCKENDLIIDDNTSLFFVEVDGQRFDVVPSGGVLEIAITQKDPGIIHINIYNESDGYHPWEGLISFIP